MFKRVMTLWPWMALLLLLMAAFVLSPSHLFMSLAPGLLFLPLLASFLFCPPSWTAAMVVVTAVAQAAIAFGHQSLFHPSMAIGAMLAAALPPTVLYAGIAATFFLYRRRYRRLLRRLSGQDDETMGLLAGGVAHDLSNMLTISLGAARIMSRSAELTESLRADLDTVTETVRTSTTLVRQLLGVISGYPLPDEKLEVNEALKRLSRQIRPSLPETVGLHVQPFPYPLMILGCGMHLQRCLLNLFMNARDAIGADGSIELRVNKRAVGAAQGNRYAVGAGEYAVVSVVDDGEGMSAKTLSRIFKPFYTTRKDGRGHGLGLAIVNEIAHKWGGFIEVTSQVGQGSCFDVYLPLIAPPAAAALVAGHASADAEIHESIAVVAAG